MKVRETAKDREHFGEYLRMYLVHKEIPQTKLAALSGIKTSRLNKIILGRQGVFITDVWAILKALEVELEYIMEKKWLAPAQAIFKPRNKHPTSEISTPYHQLICPMCGPFYSEFSDGLWKCCHKEVTESNALTKDKFEEWTRIENLWEEGRGICSK